MSRQTSRMVWPSKPSTMRPSTSMRIRGVDSGRWGACVSSSRSARDSPARRRLRLGGQALGAGEGVGHRAASTGAIRSSGGRRRTRSIASRWSAAGWPDARGRTARTRRCRAPGPPRAGRRPAATTHPHGGPRSPPGASCRSDRGWSSRTPRSSRSGSARRPARAGRSDHRRRRATPNRGGRPPRGAPRTRTACRARRAGAARPTGRRRARPGACGRRGACRPAR